jgi:hypothetical protein
MAQREQLPEEVREQHRLAAAIKQVMDVELRSHRNGLIHSALELLLQDMKRSELTGPDAGADTYMLRANAYALALLENGYYRIARVLYERMAQIVGDFRGDDPAADDWRHLGAIYINTGIIQAREGDLDRAVPSFVRTQEDDRRTYGREGPLIQEFYERYVRTPTLSDIYSICADTFDRFIAQPLDRNLIRDLAFFLEEWEYTLIATIQSLSRNREEDTRTPNLYSKLQILHGLSSLCLLFEVVAKRICEVNSNPNIRARYEARGARFTLKAALDVLYEDEGGWWDRTSNNWQDASFDQTRPGVADFETKLNQLLGTQVSSEDELRMKSILIAALIRNFLGHELDVASSITQAHYREGLKFILLAIVLVYQRARSENQV